MDRLRIAKIAIFFFLFTFSTISFSKVEVNIITWWGYFFEDLLEEVESKCDAKIYFDEYYSNPEFLRRVKKNSYDIAVFSDTVYSTFSKTVSSSGINIQKGRVSKYKPVIRDLYLNGKHGVDTTIFQISSTGFLWNPKNISIDTDDSIGEIFRKAKNKTVVLLDENVEISTLLSRLAGGIQGNKLRFPSISTIKSLIWGINVVVSNNLGTIFLKPDFAFAYTWSGEAYRIVSKHNLLKYTIHPNLSHWSKDVLTLISQKKESACVAKELSSKSYLNKLVERTYYFSPYLVTKDEANMGDDYFEIEKDLLNNFQKLKTLKNITMEDYHHLDREWQMIKVDIRLGGESNFE